MTDPIHHVPEAMIAAFAAGALPYPFACVIAAHVSLCDECRARLEAHRALGGLVLEGLAPQPVSELSRARVLAALNAEEDPFGEAPGEEMAIAPPGPYPAPLDRLLGSDGPRWRSLGFGAKQAILWNGGAGSLRLLSIPAGQAVPEHGHRGLELTLVLSGAFADEAGIFGAGDIEVADAEVGHTPRATEDDRCLCVAATDAPLRFRALLPRLLGPIFRI
jgi:putative transcriptional regulator